MAERMTRSGGPRRLLVAQLAIMLVCCGCGASCSVATVPTAGGNQPVTQSPIPPQLAPALLPPAEVAGLTDAPVDGFAQVPVQLAAPKDSFKAKGACGAVITEPSIHTGAIERLANPTSWITIWVTHPPGQEARRSLDASIADARPGCPDHDATNPDGSTERIHFAGTLPLPGIGDQSFAAHFRVTAFGQTNDAWVVLIRRGQYLTAITTGSQQPFSPIFIRALAGTADRHLTATAG
jgi:hypothetical protein